MIIVKLWGGVGNQLFQYIFGQYLHHFHNVEVLYDINSFIKTDKLRQPELDVLETKIEYYNRCMFSKHSGIRGRLLRIAFQSAPFHHFISERDTLPNIFKSNHLYYLQGYWQTEKYFRWLQQNVKGFSIQCKKNPEQLNALTNQILNTPNSVSVHIRRGDYFLPHNVIQYGVCDKEYFEKSIALLSSKVSNYKLFIFSDDLDWVKNNMKFESDVVYVPNYDISPLSYIILMSKCNHHIISNSTFSWWGAVLNENEDSIVICPSVWNRKTNNTIALDNWIKI